MQKPRIIYFGTSDLAAHIMDGLYADGNYEIVAVVTQPDKPVGRKHLMQETPVSAAAQKLSLPLLKPNTLKNDQSIEQRLRELRPDLFVVAAYGKIIPKNILDLVPGKALNVHGSLLPKYRGASPIQTAIVNGESQTGITIMLMDELMDHGPVLSQESLPIAADDTYPTLSQKMANLGRNLLLKTLSEYITSAISPVEQDHSLATATRIIDKQDGWVDWSKNATEIYNAYRGYYGWPGTWTTLNGAILKILNCKIYEVQDKQLAVHAADLKAGTVQIECTGENQKIKNIFVSCGQGFLQLLEVQLEGRKPASAESFLAGHREFINSRLE